MEKKGHRGMLSLKSPKMGMVIHLIFRKNMSEESIIHSCIYLINMFF